MHKSDAYMLLKRLEGEHVLKGIKFGEFYNRDYLEMYIDDKTVIIWRDKVDTNEDNPIKTVDIHNVIFPCKNQIPDTCVSFEVSVTSDYDEDWIQFDGYDSESGEKFLSLNERGPITAYYCPEVLACNREK